MQILSLPGQQTPLGATKGLSAFRGLGPAGAARAPRLDSRMVHELVARDMPRMHWLTDANETALYARQLTQVLALPYKYKYADIVWRNVLPVNREISTGALQHSYMMFQELGNARIVTNFGAEFPRADIVGEETLAKIISIGSSYDYSLQDLRAMAYAGIPADQMKSVVARNMIERLVDQYVCSGVPGMPSGSGLNTGLANDANIPSVTKGTQVSGTTWATATADEILKDVTSLYTTIRSNGKGAYQPNTLFLGTGGDAKVNSLRLDTFNMTTVVMYLRKSLPWLKQIIYWPQLDTVGAGTKERILLGEVSEVNAQVVIPQEFETFPPQQMRLLWEILCHMRYGGVSVRHPKAFAYMDGTQP